MQQVLNPLLSTWALVITHWNAPAAEAMTAATATDFSMVCGITDEIPVIKTSNLKISISRSPQSVMCIEGTGTPYYRLRMRLQQLRAHTCTAGRNRCEKNTKWAFVYGSRITQNCALCQLSVCTHNSDHSLHIYFSISMQFFSPNGPSFFLSMIHQVIWPSPGTLGHQASSWIFRFFFFAWAITSPKRMAEKENRKKQKVVQSPNISLHWNMAKETFEL